MADDLDQMGPIDYLVVEFPGNRMTGEAFPLLVDLVDKGVVRILEDAGFDVVGPADEVPLTTTACLGGRRLDFSVSVLQPARPAEMVGVR